MAQSLTTFKYRSPEAALRCLKDGTLYFSSPTTLNDTLEARFTSGSSDAFAAVIRETLLEIAQSKGMAATWEPSPDVHSELNGVNADENDRFRLFCEQVGIFSAARRPNHQAMWAYYADNSQGFCFELAWTPTIANTHQLLPIEVTYSDSPRVLNRADDWRTTFLELISDVPNMSLNDMMRVSLDEPFRRRWGIRSVLRATSVKHTDWQHEAEFRLIAPKAGAIPVLRDVLKRVHFIRTDHPEWRSVIQALDRDYPSVGLVQWQFDHGEITTKGQPMQLRRVPVRP